MSQENLGKEFTTDPIYTKGTKYAVTIRHNPKYKKGTKVAYTNSEKMEIYSEVLSWLVNRYDCEIVSIYYEKKGGIHLHGTLSFQRIPYFKKIKYQDVHFRWGKVYSVGWTSYCMKEIKQEIKTVSDQYIHGPNMFRPVGRSQ